MNIFEFINRFDDMIPYEIEVVIGGNLANKFKEEEEQKCRENYRGKMYPVNDTSAIEDNTIKLDYKPAQELSLPIKILVKTNPSYIVLNESKQSLGFNENITHTNKEWTSHTLRLINSNNSQVGCIMIDLNQSGDVRHQTCFYESYSGKHEIMHSVDIDTVLPKSYKDKPKTLCTKEHIIYTERYVFGTETTVEVYKVDGVVTGVDIKNKKTKTREEIMFQPLTELASNSNNPDGMIYLTRSVFDNPELAKMARVKCSYESRVLREDLQSLCGRLSGFTGDYIGHTFVMGQNYSTLCVHTQKGDYNLYTLVDLAGTKPFKDTSPFDEIDYDYGIRDDEFGRDENYLDRIRSGVDNKPLFITKKDEDGKEVLAGYKGIIFEEYDPYRGVNIRETLDKITRNKTHYDFSETEKKAFDLIYRLRDLKLTSPDENTVMDDLEDIALNEFKPFEEQFIIPFVKYQMQKLINYFAKEEKIKDRIN